MNRKVFLSFLGTSNYQSVKYIIPGNTDNDPIEVRFIQESLLQYYKSQFQSADIAYFFVTPEACEKNWVDNYHKDSEGNMIFTEGLESRLSYIDLPFRSEKIQIHHGRTEEEFWEIFQAVYHKIEPEDEIIFDVTHSFRALPMFNLVLLQYARTLKNVTIRAIHYGAFEARTEVGAPVWDLLPLVTLQDWTSAADIFIRYGNTEVLTSLTQKAIKPLLAQSQGQDKIAKSQKGLAIKLDELNLSFSTNRGKKIIDLSLLKDVQAKLYELENSSNLLYPLKPLLKSIRNKISPAAEFESIGWLFGVKWCLDHNLIQQGITQLQEGIISHVCNIYSIPYSDSKSRVEISSILSYLSSDKKNDWEWHDDVISPELRHSILIDSNILDLIPIYSAITDKRNRINHAGYLKEDNIDGDKFRESLAKLYDKIYKLLIPQDPIIINLSNHPSSSWDEMQLQEARRLFGEIIDIPFPYIDPLWDEFTIQQLSKEYSEKLIQEYHPQTIHIMGEMAFVYCMVNILQAKGVKCIVSTTQREVNELPLGRKESTFRFVRFREYPKADDLTV